MSDTGHTVNPPAAPIPAAAPAAPAAKELAGGIAGAVALGISCLGGILFVIFVALLIAFMQYQSRLTRAQPGMTADRLVYLVESQKRLSDNLLELQKLSEEITRLTPQDRLTQNEIDFRVRRICALFAGEARKNSEGEKPPEPSKQERCWEFLKMIPFRGTAAGDAQDARAAPPSPGEARLTIAECRAPAGPRILRSRTIGRANPPPPPEKPLTSEEMKAIQGKFIEVLGGDMAIGGVQLSKIIEIYTSDMEAIARKNQDYWLTIQPCTQLYAQTYAAKCEYIKKIIENLKDFRHYDGPDCGSREIVLAGSGFAGETAPSPEPTAAGAAAPAGAAPHRRLEAPAPRAAPGSPAGRSPPGADAVIARPQPSDTPAPADGQAATAAPGGLAPAAGGTGETTQRAAPSSPADQPNLAGLPVTGPLFASGAAPSPSGPPSGGAIPAVGATAPGGAGVGETALTAAERQRNFELVTHYTFYERLSMGLLRGILISPSDFLALLLVGFCGILGAVLRIVFFTYVSGKSPTWRNLTIGPILGLICALVIYILFRAGFIAITDHSPNVDTAQLSPFVLAFLGMTAGLLSERTIDFFTKTSSGWLGSVEASQAARWAVHLRSELERQNTTVDALAQRLDVSADKLKDWADEKDMVPIDKQREIALVLGIPLRCIFTDLPPGIRAQPA